MFNAITDGILIGTGIIGLILLIPIIWILFICSCAEIGERVVNVLDDLTTTPRMREMLQEEKDKKRSEK